VRWTKGGGGVRGWEVGEGRVSEGEEGRRGVR